MVITMIHNLSFLDGVGIVSNEHGCVYGLIDDILFYTPQFTDGTYSDDIDDWCEVDHMALLGEEVEVRSHVDWIEEMLHKV